MWLFQLIGIELVLVCKELPHFMDGCNCEYHRYGPKEVIEGFGALFIVFFADVVVFELKRESVEDVICSFGVAK